MTGRLDAGSALSEALADRRQMDSSWKVSLSEETTGQSNLNQWPAMSSSLNALTLP